METKVKVLGKSDKITAIIALIVVGVIILGLLVLAGTILVWAIPLLLAIALVLLIIRLLR